MAGTPIAHFDIASDPHPAFAECVDNYGVGSSEAEWPNNMISRKAVFYTSGRIARHGEPVRHAVDPDELALCRRLASEVAAIMSGVEVGMGSESGATFEEFFIAGNVDEPAPHAIDETLVRAGFGGTLFPLASITVEPMDESGTWWSEVEEDGAESEPDYFHPWRVMIRWFRDRPEFVDSAFVRVGDSRALEEIPDDQFPPGTELVPCVLPRLALGLTKGGSLVGLFGFSVQT